ncbi:unnamed protein product [Caenorhabditis brenneri]
MQRQFFANNKSADLNNNKQTFGINFLYKPTRHRVLRVKCYNEKFKSEEERQENLQSWTEKINLNSDKEET